MYLRAENGEYLVNATTVKSCTDTTSAVVWPAIDTRLSSSTASTWVNPSSFQIFSPGLDCTYGTLTMEQADLA